MKSWSTEVTRSARARVAALAMVLGAALAPTGAHAADGPFFRTAPVPVTGTESQVPAAEVVHFNGPGTRIAAQNQGGGVSLVDSSNLFDAFTLARYNVSDASAGPEPTSATFTKDGRHILAVEVTEGPTEFGVLIVLDTAGDTLKEVRRIALRGQPDSIEVSPDGRFAAIAIEDEDDEIPAVGVVYVVELVDQADPETWIAREVDFTMDASYPGNTEPQPEYVDINGDNEIAFSIQEQSAIGIIDAEATADGDPSTDPVTRIFSVGRATFNDDAVSNDQTFNFDPSPPTINDQPREPDAVGWTADGEAIVAVAEGENSNPQEWFIVDREGNLVYSSGVAMQRDMALYGLNSDGRNEPEGLDVFSYRGTEYAMLVIERAAQALVYDIDDRTDPQLVTVVPTGQRPETITFNAAQRAAITGNEEDAVVPISAIRALERGELDPDRPQIEGDQPWYNLRGLTAESSTRLLTIPADRPRRVRRIEITARGEATLTTLGAVPGGTTGLGNGAEDLAGDGSGGVWVAGTPSGAGAEIEHMSIDGTPLGSIDLPDDLDPTGIARAGDHLIVLEAGGEAARVRISDGSVERFTVTSTAVPAGQFTDLATAPDGRIVALRADANNNGAGAGETALVTFPADAPAGAPAAASTVRTITRAEQTLLASDRRTALAVTPTGDVWTAHGAAFNTQVGGDPDLWRIPGELGEPPPAPPADQGIPSAFPAQPLIGLDYMLAGGELYARGGSPTTIVNRQGVPAGPAVTVSATTGKTIGEPGLFRLDLGPNGVMFRATPDGAGGLYAVVNAATINGQPVPGRSSNGNSLVHVLAGGTIDAGFTPPVVSTNGTPGPTPVQAAYAGGRIWLLGIYTAVNGVPRTNLVALRPDGSVDTGVDIPATSAFDFRLVGSSLYVRGGANMTLGGQLRPHIARIDLSGPVPAVDAWNPQPSGTVFAIAEDGARVFLAGEFRQLAGQPADRLAQVNATTGALERDFAASFPVNVVATLGRKLLFGTDRDQNLTINGAPTEPVAWLNLDDLAAPATGLPVKPRGAFQEPRMVPLSDGGLATMFVNDGELARARDVNVLDADLRPRASFVSANRASSSNATLIELSPGVLLVTGTGSEFVFGEIGPTRRWVRLDPRTGDVDPRFVVPDELDRPGTMAADDRWLYVPIDEDLRNGVARLDRVTGEQDPSWRVFSDEFEPRDLQLAGDRLYMARGFTSVNGEARPEVAAVSAATGDLLPFNPRTNRAVEALATGDGRVFLAGAFTRAAGDVVGGILEVDPDTGEQLDTFEGVFVGGDTSSFEGLQLAYDSERERLYLANARTVDGAPSGGLVAFDVSGASARRIASFDPQVVGQVLRIAPAFGGLLVSTSGNTTLDGVPVTGGVALVGADGELDDRFVSRTNLRGGGIVAMNVAGSSVTVNGQLYLPAAPTKQAAPEVTGDAAREGVEQTCEPGTWDGAPDFAYAWLRGGQAIGGATLQTYTPVAADVGQQLSCRVTATNQLGSGTATSAEVAITAGVPFESQPPAITGTPVAGQVLSASAGAWSNAPTSFAYDWRVDGTSTGVTTATYTVAAGDAGKDVTVRVVATNAVGDSAAATSAAVRIAEVPTAVPDAAPVISGSGAVGSPLTVSPGGWTGSPTAFAYQWLRNGAPIAGATQSSYTPVDADEGASLTARVTASTVAGGSAPRTSAGILVPLPPPPAVATTPTIAGPGIVGTTVTCEPGRFTGKGPITVAVRWLRSGSPIAGATTRAYELAAGDVGRAIACEERATNKGGTTVSTSESISPVPAGSGPAPVMVAPITEDALAILEGAAAAGPAVAAVLDPPSSARRGRRIRIRIEAGGPLTSARLVVRRRGRTYATGTARTLGETGALTVRISRSAPRGTYSLRLTARDAHGRLVVATEELTLR